ncbi:MAG: tetratricopeptide repeat protein [Casimicrobiaceae bacterium]
MTNISIAEIFEQGLEHHRAGRLAQAEAAYRRILQNVPGQPDALHMLGVIAHQAGRNAIALGLIDSAIAVNAGHPGYHNHRGIVLHALGRVDDAVASYRRAVELKPDYAEAHNGLATALVALGRIDEATAGYRAALSFRPDYPEAHNNLGNALRDQGRLAESLGCYRRALELRRDFADAHANLGNALYDLGEADAALASYARAVSLRDTSEFRTGFALCMRGASFHDADPKLPGVEEIRRLAIRALSEPWARPADIARACIRLIAGDPAIGGCVARASSAWPERLTGASLFGPGGIDAVSGDPLLRALLVNAQACDLAMERFLTTARHALLEALEREDASLDQESVLTFACALARQCHINDYVFSATDAETRRTTKLRKVLVDAIAGNTDIPAAALALVACYFPLSAVPGNEALLARSWPDPVAALLARQVAEPREERRLCDRMTKLTPVDDEVSRRVRQQYEENPYPRWVKSAPIGPAQTVESHLRGMFPLVPLSPRDERQGVDILVAGCGTGQESIEAARQFANARVLAIDLSLASLAYAERKARELGIGNVEHAQADILRLDAIDRTFDVIASAGVLHHLADPLGGWRKLASLLRPGGFMRIGLYSERGRETVVAARRLIAERGYSPTAEGIRRCREDLMSESGGATFAPLALLRDFYVTGECRDLLFHVEEHRFSLPQIRDMLAALDLRFLGFLLAPGVARRYAQRHPADPAMTDLDAWAAFETEFPEAFAGMYVFWVQKAT